MFRVLLCLPLSLFCMGNSCKTQESKAPDIEHLPPDMGKNGSSPGSFRPDRYGDPLPTMAVGRLGSTRMIDRYIRHMILSADGTQVYSTHKDGFAIWELSDASRSGVLKHGAPGNLMAASPNGKLLATEVDDANSVTLWNLESKTVLAILPLGSPLVGVCFLDDQRLVTATQNGAIQTWNPTEATAEPSVFAGPANGTALGCSPHHGWLGIGTKTGESYVWNHGDPTAIRLGKADKEIRSVAIASDISAFAFGSEDEKIYLWRANKTNTAPQQKAIVMEAHDRQVINLAFTPDNKKLYSSGGDFWFRIWDARSGELLEEIPGIGGLEAQLMALSPDGTLMISWSVHGNERGSEAGRWWLWNAVSGDLLLEPERHRLALTDINWSPDGTMLATTSEDRTVRVWDAASTKSLKRLSGAEGHINAIRFSKDGKYVFSAGVDALIRRWDWQRGTDKDPVESIGGAVNAFVILPDGSRIITGDQIGRAWAWDVKSGNQIQAYDRKGYAAIHGLALSPDGKLLAIAGSSRIIRVINLGTGKEVAQLNPGDTKANYAVDFSPDGTLLASAGDEHKIQLWSTVDWAQVQTMTGHDGTIRSIKFAPSGKVLASGANDESARVWDVESGKELVAYEGHTGAVTSVAISPDGTMLATASRDRTALLWPMPDGEKPMDAKPTGEKPTAEMPAAQMPTGETTTGEMPTGQTPTEEKPTAEMPAAQMPTGETTTGEMPKDN